MFRSITKLYKNMENLDLQVRSFETHQYAKEIEGSYFIARSRFNVQDPATGMPITETDLIHSRQPLFTQDYVDSVVQKAVDTAVSKLLAEQKDVQDLSEKTPITVVSQEDTVSGLGIKIDEGDPKGNPKGGVVPKKKAGRKPKDHSK